MHIESIAARNVPPVTLFNVSGLSNLVVIAGPNGVGKTRLVSQLVTYLRGGSPGDPRMTIRIRATSDTERDEWGMPSLDLTDSGDMAKFRATLGRGRRRRNWTSSILNFESDRTIQNLRPLQFSWDMVDPEVEEVSWDTTFSYMRDRFQDTVHSMYRMIDAQKRSISNRAVELRRQGHTSMNLEFDDPMLPFKEVFARLLPGKTMEDPIVSDQHLRYSDGIETYEFASLSSGEREVVNIAFDFLLRKPSDCIVFFDEPELHLHSELSYRLIQTLQTLGERNQFILTTHSPDVISSSLDHSVIFLSPPRGPDDNQALDIKEDDTTNEALRTLGQSVGIIALGRKLVLIEGDKASIDKKTYGRLIEGRFPQLVLVPASGRHTLESFESVYRSVLSQTLWGVDFHMLCDGDSRPLDTEASRDATSRGRLRSLPRYHIENYFLDEEVWAAAFRSLEGPSSWLRDKQAIARRLVEAARDLVSYVVALEVSAELRRKAGNLNAMPKDCHQKSLDELTSLMLATLENERHRIDISIASDSVATLIAERFSAVTDSLDAASDVWRRRIPGRPVLNRFAAHANIDAGRAKHLYLETAMATKPEIFSDILDIFAEFARE